MEISAQLVPVSSRWAGQGIPEADLGSVFFQPNRLDVLVHLLAFEHLAGAELPAGEAKDWVRWSDQFATQDNEPTVGTLAAELLTSPEAELAVTFASGGQLVRGASAAAAAISSGRVASRREGDDKVIDRSVPALLAEGWSLDQVHRLLIEWAGRDTAAQVVLVDLESDGAVDVVHELTCRYAIMHQELEFIAASDVGALQAASTGSTQVFCVRATGNSVSAVLERHADAIRATASGPGAASILASLWDSQRVVQPSAEHQKRVRQDRVRQAAAQVYERLRGR